MGRPKITYNSITMDFPEGAGAQNLSIQRQPQTARTQAKSGKQKFLHYFRNRFINFTLPYYNAEFEAELLALMDYMESGQTCKLQLDSDVGLYVPFEGKSGKSSDEDTPTFTRVDGATDLSNAVDPYTGLVTAISTGVQRFEAGKFGKAATLIENSHSGNIILNSEDFNDANWTKSGVTTSPTPVAIAPDGTLSAHKLTFTAISDIIYYDTATAIGTDDCCFSVWLKTLSSNVSIGVKIDDDTGATKGSKQVTVTSTWQRFNVAFENGGSDADNWRFTLQAIAGGEVVYAWGAQPDINKLYPTSYIKSSGAPPNTRQEEVLYFEPDADNLNMLDFTISFWFKVPYAYNTHPDDNKSFAWLSQTVDTNRAVSVLHLTAGTWEIRVYDYESNVGAGIDSASLQFTADTWTHFAITFDGSGNNGLKFYGNGALITSSSNTPFTPSAFDRLFIAMRDATIPADHIDGLIDDFAIHKKALTAAQISDYYNSGHGWGYKKNIWDAVYLRDFNYTTKFVNGAKKIVQTNLKFEEQLT